MILAIHKLGDEEEEMRSKDNNLKIQRKENVHDYGDIGNAVC